jgi:hypothetical protein
MSLLVLCVAHVYFSLILPFSVSPLCVVLFAIFLAIQSSYVPPCTILHINLRTKDSRHEIL